VTVREDWKGYMRVYMRLRRNSKAKVVCKDGTGPRMQHKWTGPRGTPRGCIHCGKSERGFGSSQVNPNA
jgi:hypothetical protein